MNRWIALYGLAVGAVYGDPGGDSWWSALVLPGVLGVSALHLFGPWWGSAWVVGYLWLFFTALEGAAMWFAPLLLLWLSATVLYFLLYPDAEMGYGLNLDALNQRLARRARREGIEGEYASRGKGGGSRGEHHRRPGDGQAEPPPGGLGSKAGRRPGPPRYLPPDLQVAYTTLGLPWDAPLDEVTRRYRRLVGRHHPDRQGPDASPEALAEANEATRRLREAYERIRRHLRGMAARAE
ncbi:MAG: DnaJ family molecular chaperone [Candidatus Competibacterales bacterium]